MADYLRCFHAGKIFRDRIGQVNVACFSAESALNAGVHMVRAKLGDHVAKFLTRNLRGLFRIEFMNYFRFGFSQPFSP